MNFIPHGIRCFGCPIPGMRTARKKKPATGRLNSNFE
jgi:hypothetical protein